MTLLLAYHLAIIQRACAPCKRAYALFNIFFRSDVACRASAGNLDHVRTLPLSLLLNVKEFLQFYVQHVKRVKFHVEFEICWENYTFYTSPPNWDSARERHSATTKPKRNQGAGPGLLPAFLLGLWLQYGRCPWFG